MYDIFFDNPKNKRRCMSEFNKRVKRLMLYKAQTFHENAFVKPEIINTLDMWDDNVWELFCIKLIKKLESVNNNPSSPKNIIEDEALCPFCVINDICGNCLWAHENGICEEKDSLYAKILEKQSKNFDSNSLISGLDMNIVYQIVTGEIQ